MTNRPLFAHIQGMPLMSLAHDEGVPLWAPRLAFANFTSHLTLQTYVWALGHSWYEESLRESDCPLFLDWILPIC